EVVGRVALRVGVDHAGRVAERRKGRGGRDGARGLAATSLLIREDDDLGFSEYHKHVYINNIHCEREYSGTPEPRTRRKMHGDVEPPGTPELRVTRGTRDSALRRPSPPAFRNSGILDRYPRTRRLCRALRSSGPPGHSREESTYRGPSSIPEIRMSPSPPP